MIPDKIERQHILEAIQEFKNNGFPAGYKASNRYQIIHENVGYAPPAIFALAVKSKTGSLPEKKFSVGEKSKCFQMIRACGFKIEGIEKR